MDKQSSAAYMRHIRDLTAGYPRFEDGRVNYTDERVCFVLNCVVVSDDQILLTKRSSEVIAYPGLVNGISGFIDNPNLSIEDIAYSELAEEVGISKQHIIRMKLMPGFAETVGAALAMRRL